jgi:hypothetical protein
VEEETLPRVVKGLRCQPGPNALFEPKRQFPKLPTCTSRARRKVPDDPPDPENGSPASAGTERGADHLKKSAKSSPRKTTLRPDKSQASKRANLAVYSGQTWLGTIEVRQDGSDFAAFNTTDRFLGSFGTLKAAADAVDAAANGGGL